MPKELDIVVTAPHQKCPPNSRQRACDLAAGSASQCLCQVLGQVRRPKITCWNLPGDEHRSDHDLNRLPSRKTKYRQKLTQVLESLSRPALVVDVHSFPGYWMEEAGDINFFKRDELAPEIVLLEGPNDKCNGTSLTFTLYQALAQSGIHVKIIQGITVNDILNQSNEYNIPGILIEFCETLNSDQGRLLQICKILSSQLVKFA